MTEPDSELVEFEFVKMTNSSDEPVWIGAGEVSDDLTVEQMLETVESRAFGSNEAVMGLFVTDAHAGFSDHLEPGEASIGQMRMSETYRLAVWCFTPPDGSDAAYLAGFLEP